MADRLTWPVASEQHEVLCQALADAVSYRDPPVECLACEMLEAGLCAPCAAGLARARAYLAVRREIENGPPE